MENFTAVYNRKPFSVEAVQVTEENMKKIAEWCEGDILETKDGDAKYIKVHVARPLNLRQTKAFVGDWVLFAGKGFKVYSDKAFGEAFVPVN